MNACYDAYCKCEDGCEAKYPCLDSCRRQFTYEAVKFEPQYTQCRNACGNTVHATHHSHWNATEKCTSCIENVKEIEDEILSADCVFSLTSALSEACAMFSDKMAAFKEICSLPYKQACPAMKALITKQTTVTAKKLCKVFGGC